MNNSNLNSPSNNNSSATATPRIFFKNALATVPVPEKLLKGLCIIKVEANGKSQEVYLRISQDKFTINIRSPEGNGVFGFFSSLQRKTDEERAVDIGEIDRLQRGQSTQQFEMAKKNADRMEAAVFRKTELNRNSSTGSSSQQLSVQSQQLLQTVTQVDPQRSFSIIFRGAHTLDLMAESANDRDEIFNTLDRILLAYQRAKIRVANDVLLLR
jgi:hypothetical protein